MHFCQLEAHLGPWQHQVEASYAGKTFMQSIYKKREPFSRRDLQIMFCRGSLMEDREEKSQNLSSVCLFFIQQTQTRINLSV